MAYKVILEKAYELLIEDIRQLQTRWQHLEEKGVPPRE